MIKDEIIEAGQNLKTIIINYTEQDGSNEGDREIEPYSLREKNGIEYFYGYDINKGGIRAFIVDSIEDVRITDNNYSPQWPVEF